MKMPFSFTWIAWFCLSNFIYKSSIVDSSPVIIPDPIKPRLPENICFNEALEEGGR